MMPRFITWRLIGASAVAVVSAGVLAACGANLAAIGPGSLTALDKCLEKHGIAHPEESAPASSVEKTIPILLGIRGIHVPREATQTEFEGALKTCGAADVRVAPAPITNPLLQQRVERLAQCLAANGFRLPPPDFPGPGPVLDTQGVDIASARWIATARACSVTTGVAYKGVRLNEALLKACLGDQALEGAARTNAQFQRRIEGLPACLRGHRPQ
jgi:hypothetical protein